MAAEDELDILAGEYVLGAQPDEGIRTQNSLRGPGGNLVRCGAGHSVAVAHRHVVSFRLDGVT